MTNRLRVTIECLSSFIRWRGLLECRKRRIQVDTRLGLKELIGKVEAKAPSRNPSGHFTPDSPFDLLRHRRLGTRLATRPVLPL